MPVNIVPFMALRLHAQGMAWNVGTGCKRVVVSLMFRVHFVALCTSPRLLHIASSKFLEALTQPQDTRRLVTSLSAAFLLQLPSDSFANILKSWDHI